MLLSGIARSSKTAVLRQLSARYVSTTMRLSKAQVFAMPAMSPTMEKGGVVEWKYKVGEKFSAGDVILEVETDKAQIDVEAQDDGQLAKIVFDNGAKDIAVGEPIAYIAETDDDLSTLELPKAAEKPKAPLKKKEEAKKDGAEKKAPVKSSPSGSEKKATSGGALQTANPKQTLFPSVSSLLAENGISKEDAFNKIKATGRDGRLLKGDVLAYLGKISSDSNVKIADYIKSGERLDLSNIELRVQEAKPATQGPPQATKPVPVVLSEQFVLECPASVEEEELQRSVRAFFEEAYQYTHEAPLANARSEHFDPIFEDLITIAPSQPRFKYTYQLVSLTDEVGLAGHQDIFDLLSDTGAAPRVKGNEGETSSKKDYVLSFNVQVSDKFDDSNEKSQRFVDYLKQLQFV